MRIAALGTLTLLLFGCSSSPSQTAANKFDLTRDAFSFPNFTQGTGLTADYVARMFGTGKVCVNNALPCEPSDAAKAWIATENDVLADGHSEGMAVLAQLFFLKKLDPNDFGASTVRGLAITGNYKLQAELAYFSATQQVPAAGANDKRFAAKDVIDFLRTSIADESEAYRLALAVKTDSGFAQGHSVVPFGFYPGDRDGLYYIRIYDNNFPNTEKRIEVDTKANTWRYDGSVDPSQPVVYSGNATDDNLLYFSPVTPRLGTFSSPFGDDATNFSAVSEGPVEVMVQGAGFSAGIKNGQVIEQGSVRVTPAFSYCACQASPGTSGIMQVTAPKSGMGSVSIVGGLGAQGGTTTSGTVAVTGPSTSLKVSGINGNPDKTDNLTFDTDASGNTTIDYVNNSGTPATITYTNKDGITATVQVGGASSDIRVTVNANGQVSVATRGTAAGTTIDVDVQIPKGLQAMDGIGGQTQVVTDSSGSNLVSINSATGAVTSSGGTETMVSLPCFNGQLDAGESDIDCGGVCATPCAAGKHCQTSLASDCATGSTCVASAKGSPTGTCVAAHCMDGLKNNDETDVDCGGPSCAVCAQGKSCMAASDCATRICGIDKKCDTQGQIYLTTTRTDWAPPNPVPVNLTADGVSSSVSWKGIGSILLGYGNSYDVEFGTFPAGVSCTFGSSPPHIGSITGGSVAIFATCTYTATQLAGRVTNILWDAPGGATTQNEYGTLSFNVVRDGSGSIVMANTPYPALGSFGASYSVSIATQPGVHQVGGNWYYTTCKLPGATGSWAPTSGTYKGDFTDTLLVSCDSYSCASQAMCPPPSLDLGVAVDMAAGPPDLAMTPPDLSVVPDLATPPGGCTVDSDCTNQDCECGDDSGNCTGATGRCGAGKVVIDTATSDGVTASGTFTVPALCTQVHIEAWGAAGGSAVGMMIPFPMPGLPGGSGGYVSGYVSTAQSDVLTAWIGQGGISAGAIGDGTPGIGSLAGVMTNGGAGDGNIGSGQGGGGGGGLTSVQQTGGAMRTFSVPAGGGGGGLSAGGSGGAGGATNSSNNGQDAAGGSFDAGGGAGEPGGASDTAGVGGSFGTLPSGLTSQAGGPIEPANSSANDYGLCVGISAGQVNAGAGNGVGNEGGDGCVVIRCKGL